MPVSAWQNFNIVIFLEAAIITWKCMMGLLFVLHPFQQPFPYFRHHRSMKPSKVYMFVFYSSFVLNIWKGWGWGIYILEILYPGLIWMKSFVPLQVMYGDALRGVCERFVCYLKGKGHNISEGSQYDCSCNIVWTFDPFQQNSEMVFLVEKLGLMCSWSGPQQGFKI